MSVFASRLKEIRKKNRMTMPELGRRIGVAKSTIAGYENGDREPSLRIVASIARVCNVSSDYLLGLTDLLDPAPKKTVRPAGGFHWKGEPLTEEELELVLSLLQKTQTSAGTDAGPKALPK
ncbi:helix-turn-helix transcriptional regulator [Paenibacillus sp.]|uniref:helix-turn-helix domain-containing protein n=1 Tax=Paenibacillus sp. TaxID=58172 RepID=UPI002D610872|nr:helix-turn-helix transcriptional regulator [Paenibacillus sp.]HZG55676.1 helix-turn-helix transcriptional regulator [Paenibacillus sp.]